MAIFTPTGLKIRLPTDYVFALAARLRPRSGAREVLDLTELVAILPAPFGVATALAVFTLQPPPLTTAVVTGITLAAVRLGHVFEWVGLPMRAGLAVNRALSGWILVAYLPALGLGYATSGWKGVSAFLGGYAVAWVVGALGGLGWGLRMRRTSGRFLHASERSFFIAYRVEASRLGVSRELEVRDDELEPDNWAPAFQEFAAELPDVAARITTDWSPR